METENIQHILNYIILILGIVSIYLIIITYIRSRRKLSKFGEYLERIGFKRFFPLMRHGSYPLFEINYKGRYKNRELRIRILKGPYSQNYSDHFKTNILDFFSIESVVVKEKNQSKVLYISQRSLNISDMQKLMDDFVSDKE